MLIKIHRVLHGSHVDGPDGPRAVLFMQGCSLACPGCQNRALWPTDAGHTYPVDVIGLYLDHACRYWGDRAITISGGEPFQQPAALLRLLQVIKGMNPFRNILIYSGYTLDELMTGRAGIGEQAVFAILRLTDILVDGRFDFRQSDDFLTYRGSRNQRAIDVQATLAGPEIVCLNWDAPEIIISEKGNLLTPAGVTDLDSIGDTIPTRRCGQTN